MNDTKDFDFERFKAWEIKGIFAPLLKHFLESVLEGELGAYLQKEKANRYYQPL